MRWLRKKQVSSMSKEVVESAASSRVAALFQARSVAVVGASSDPEKITGRPLAYMLARGFTGELYPVNPARTEVQGLRAYRSLSDVGKPIDLAIVGTAAEQVDAIVQEGIAVGVKAFVVFSSGFAEIGERGRALQERLRALAREHGVAILGPNCLGIANSATGLIASFTTAMESAQIKPGRFAFVSQSGALGAYWLDIVLRSGIGFSQWISTGNECDVDAAEAIDFLADDPNTDVIGVYLEDIRDAQAFKRALQKAARAHKPVIAIKSGRSQAGAQAAASHTGALAGDDVLYDACLMQYGALRVDSLSELIDAAQLFLCKSVAQGPRLAVMSVSGGAGVLIADESEALGMQLPPFEEKTCTELKTLLPSFAHAANPLDLTGNVVQNTDSIGKALTAVAADPNVDSIVLFVGLMHSIADAFTNALANARKHTQKPIVVIWMGAMPKTCSLLEAAGIPVFSDIPQGMRAIAASHRLLDLQASAREAQMPAMRPHDRRGQPRALSEWDGKQLLAAQSAVNIPKGVLMDVPGSTTSHPEWPVAVKIQSPQLLHKSDAGGVALGIKTAEALEAAVKRMFDLGAQLKIGVQGVLVEQMVPFDHELVLGLRHDVRFGSVLTIGRGGVEVELDPDAVTRLLPLGAKEIEAMLMGLRSARLLQGFRGRKAVDIPRLARKIATLCEWFDANPSLAEVEINPLAVRGGEAWALDALVTQNA